MYIPLAFQGYETKEVEGEERGSKSGLHEMMKKIKLQLEWNASMRGMSSQIANLRPDDGCRYSG